MNSHISACGSKTSKAEELEIKCWMLGVMLIKLSKLYPQFADTVYWERANEILADFCIPDRFRSDDWHNLDMYYIDLISRYIHVAPTIIAEGFLLASESEATQS